MMSTTNRVHSDVSSSAATPAKRSRFDNDGSGKLSDRVAELEEDWSDLNNQVSELGRQLEDKNLELSSSSKCVEALTSSLNVERAKCEDLQTKLVEANLKSSSLEAANDELNEQVRQASENNLELQNSLEASNRLIAELTATNVNLQSDLDKQSIFAEEINSKLIASSDVISELNENLETLDKDVTEYKKRIDNMSQRNSEFKLLVSDRDSLAGQVNRLKKANTHYKNQRDQLRTLLAKVTQTPIVTNDAPTVTSSNVQLVNPGRDPRVARPAPSFNIIRELRSKRTITAQMFCAAKHLEFEKYYPKGNLATKKVYKILETAVRKIEDGNRVLVLIDCSFVVLCLRTFYNPKCTFVIRKKINEELSIFGYKFDVYEALDERKDKRTLDLVLNDQEYLSEDVRSIYMKVNGRALNCVAGKRSYSRRH